MRLCFEVFLEDPLLGVVALTPIVSNVIKDKKMYGEMKIVEISQNWAYFEGGLKILMFCSKISRNDIEIRFDFEGI